jgi:hypothetical protein
MAFSVWDENLEEFQEPDENENLLYYTSFFTVIVYINSHLFTVHGSVLPYLPEWKAILNVKWLCTRKHICTEKVILLNVTINMQKKIHIRKRVMHDIWVGFLVEVTSLYSASPFFLPGSALSSQFQSCLIMMIIISQKMIIIIVTAVETSNLVS